MNQFLGLAYGRKESQEYGKGVMNEKPVLEATKDVYYHDSASQSHSSKFFETMPQTFKTHTQNQIQKDFDTTQEVFKPHNNYHFQKKMMFHHQYS